MTDAQFQVVKNISTADLLSVISVRAATMEDELRRANKRAHEAEKELEMYKQQHQEIYNDPMSW